MKNSLSGSLTSGVSVSFSDLTIDALEIFDVRVKELPARVRKRLIPVDFVSVLLLLLLGGHDHCGIFTFACSYQM